MSLSVPSNFFAKSVLNSTVAAVALVGAAGVAHAQDADASEGVADRSMQEIIVTARRVDESVQDIPISVGVLGEDMLEAKAISDFQDLKASVVGLTTSRTGTAGGGYVTIRGVTPVATPQPASDSGVGFFIDGIYVARSQGAGAPLVDIQRVEVLRGPQGTLFGRNSSIGAINFITNTPVDYLTASASASYGNFNEVEAEAMINFPITPDFIARVAYKHHEIEGDVKNSYEGPGFNYSSFGAFEPAKAYDSENSESILARLRYTGIEGVTIDYKYDREDVHTTPPVQQIIGFAPGDPTSPAYGLAFLIQGLYQYNQFFNPGGVVQSFTPLDEVSQDHGGNQRIKNDGHMLDVSVELSDAMKLRSITGYRTTKSNGATDLDGGSWQNPPAFLGFIPAGAVCVSCSTNTMDQHAWSEELQLIGDFGEGIDYVFGAYYFDEHAAFKNTYSLLSFQPYAPAVYQENTNLASVIGTPGDYVLGNDGIYDNLSYALYGHLDYAFSDFFDISLGLRHTWDDRKTNDRRSFGSGKQSYKDSRFTYDAALNVHPSQDILVFAKYARGYTAGGIDGNFAFLPEVNDQVELGFKGEFLDRTLTVNASVYQTWIENRQSTLPNTSTTCNATLLLAGFTNPCPVGLFVYNLPGTTKIKGFEFETIMRPSSRLTFTANLGYNDPKFSTNELHRAPKLTMAYSAQYDFPEFGNGSYLTARIDADYRGDYYPTGGNAPTSFTNGVVPAGLRDGLSNEDYLAQLRNAAVSGDYFLVNGRLALAEIPIGGARAELAGYVRNLFDSRGQYYSVNYGYHYAASWERPRQYGVKLSVDF